MTQTNKKEQSIGEKLRILRKESKLTLLEVAEKAGVTATAIHSYERNIRNPSMKIVDHLAKIYGTTKADILGITQEVDYESSNIKKILSREESSSQLHWDGIPLEAEDLQMIKQFLEYSIQKNKNKNKKDDDNDNVSVCNG